ncbi:hypothetical protein [Rufibacter latericius]|uniref:hypothetical protein n=1 Tax=Rufibacter latericius TaxID=2487040 RepID=UPI001401C91D|nr:hypothetical protein [Rufibacter latericius]
MEASQCEAFSDYILSKLKETPNPRYATEKKAKKRITKLLLRLDHFAPIIP